MARADYNYKINPKYDEFRKKFVETSDRQQEIEAEWKEAGCPIMDIEIAYYAEDSKKWTSKSFLTINQQHLIDFYPDDTKWNWAEIDTDAIFNDLFNAENYLDNLAWTNEQDKEDIGEER